MSANFAEMTPYNVGDRVIADGLPNMQGTVTALIWRKGGWSVEFSCWMQSGHVVEELPAWRVSPMPQQATAASPQQAPQPLKMTAELEKILKEATGKL